MIKAKKSFPPDLFTVSRQRRDQEKWISGRVGDDNERTCPQCETLSLKGMPGGSDSICKNCGYKDPCCYD